MSAKKKGVDIDPRQRTLAQWLKPKHEIQSPVAGRSDADDHSAARSSGEAESTTLSKLTLSSHRSPDATACEAQNTAEKSSACVSRPAEDQSNIAYPVPPAAVPLKAKAKPPGRKALLKTANKRPRSTTPVKQRTATTHARVQLKPEVAPLAAARCTDVQALPLTRLLDAAGVELPAVFSSLSTVHQWLIKRLEGVPRHSPVELVNGYVYDRPSNAVKMILKCFGYLQNHPLLRIALMHLAVAAYSTQGAAPANPPRRGVALPAEQETGDRIAFDENVSIAIGILDLLRSDVTSLAAAELEIMLKQALFPPHHSDVKPSNQGWVVQAASGRRSAASPAVHVTTPGSRGWPGVSKPKKVCIDLPLDRHHLMEFVRLRSFTASLRNETHSKVLAMKQPLGAKKDDDGSPSSRFQPKLPHGDLLILPSYISVARYGLYLRGFAPSGTAMAEYAGALEDVMDPTSGYRMTFSVGRKADANIERCFCSMINDSRGSPYTNACRFKGSHQVFAKAMRNISYEEVFVNYGSSFVINYEEAAAGPSRALCPDFAVTLCDSTVVPTMLHSPVHDAFTTAAVGELKPPVVPRARTGDSNEADPQPKRRRSGGEERDDSCGDECSGRSNSDCDDDATPDNDVATPRESTSNTVEGVAS